MKISSAFTGSLLREHRVTVQWRDTMNYAAAVRDDNPLFFDDEGPAGIIAPPMFCVALTWPVSENLGQNIQATDFPEECLSTMVHYTEHLQFHRPVVPGDRLVINGKIAAIRTHWTGTHIILRFEAKDEQGQPVFTEHIGGILRGVECEGKSAHSCEVPEFRRRKKWSEPAEWKSFVDVDPFQTFIYDGCADMFFPIHTSVKFARSVGLSGIIVQGTATLAMAVREITNGFADTDPRRIRTIACRFTDMVLPGSRITIEAAEDEKKDGLKPVHFFVKNENGKRAVSDGLVMID